MSSGVVILLLLGASGHVGGSEALDRGSVGGEELPPWMREREEKRNRRKSEQVPSRSENGRKQGEPSQNFGGLQQLNSAGGRVEVLEEIVKVSNNNPGEFIDGSSSQEQGPSEQDPRKVHRLQ